MTPSDPQFIDLASYRKVDAPGRAHGNIIKASRITVADSAEIDPPSDEPGKPVVVLHREGDRITTAEFICQCGRSATFQLEYEQE